MSKRSRRGKKGGASVIRDGRLLGVRGTMCLRSEALLEAVTDDRGGIRSRREVLGGFVACHIGGCWTDYNVQTTVIDDSDCRDGVSKL